MAARILRRQAAKLVDHAPESVVRTRPSHAESHSIAIEWLERMCIAVAFLAGLSLLVPRAATRGVLRSQRTVARACTLPAPSPAADAVTSSGPFFLS